MYINNTKKLFEDLNNIESWHWYMADQPKDLDNLLSILDCYHDALHDGGEGSCTWDLSQFEEDDKENREKLIKDNQTMKNIWNIVKKELKAKYILKCSHCGDVFFYGKKPKYEISKYQCLCKKIGTLQIMEFNKWATDEILDIRRRYFKGK